MSARGGIYTGPGGQLLHGDGRLISMPTPVRSEPMFGAWWYTARVKNSAGVHGVFYSTTRPTIGATCPGVAGPNCIVGYRREVAPTAPDGGKEAR